MKKILLIGFMLAGVIAYGANNGDASGNVNATANVMSPIVVLTGPDADMDVEDIRFGSIIAGNARNTWDKPNGALPTGVGPGGFRVVVTRPTTFIDDVWIDYYLECANNGGIGKVKLSPKPGAGATGNPMTAQLHLADAKEPAAAPAALSSTQWGYEKDLGTNSDWAQYVHGSLEETDTTGRDGDFEGTVTVHARYSDTNKNPWRN